MCIKFRYNKILSSGRQLALLVCMGMLSVNLYCQQINLVDKITANYRDVKSFSMDIQCQLDFVTGYKGPAFNSTGKIVKDGENYYSRIMGITSITTDKYQYLMDEGQQVILLQNRAPANALEQFNLPFAATDKWYEQYDFTFENNKKTILITMVPKAPDKYKEFKIRVDAKKYYLLEVHTYYNIDKNQVVASHLFYTNNKFGQKVDADFFNLEPYITIKNNKEVVATPAYKKYRLINYLNNVNK